MKVLFDGFLDFLSENRPLDLFCTKFVLTHRQDLINSEYLCNFLSSSIDQILLPSKVINPTRGLPKPTFELLLLSMSIINTQSRSKIYSHILSLLNVKEALEVE